MVNKSSADSARQQFETLKATSAELGADPLQIQGAGGNTSIKQDDVLWIKASGKWLMHAADEDMFVPVHRSALLDAFYKDDARAEKSMDFIVEELNPQSLRPSIETTLHAVLDHKVVIHVHCIDTISIAIREDAEQQLDTRLAGFNWRFIPYVRPGLPLSRSIAERLEPQTDVLVLGNHGLVVAANSVEGCLSLLEKVRLALRCEPRSFPVRQSLSKPENLPATFVESLATRLGSGGDYQPAQSVQAHTIAFDEIALDVAAGGSLYPDHVIFLGEGTVIAQPEEDCDGVVRRYEAAGATAPVCIVFPDAGVAMSNDATAGQQAMARCIADVCSRVPSSATINYLSDSQNHELLNWEAEQYRQVLNQSPA